MHLPRRRPGVTIAELAASAQETEPDVRSFLLDATERGFLARAAGRRRDGSTAWRLADGFQAILAPILPCFKRPTSESLTLIEDLARTNGTIRNEDVRDAIGVNQVRASQLLSRAAAEGGIRLPPEPNRRDVEPPAFRPAAERCRRPAPGRLPASRHPPFHLPSRP